MTLVLRNRADITLDAVYRVAWQGEDVRLHDDARARMAEARAAFLRLLDSDPDIVIYGVTTGYGQNARIRLSPEERKDQAKRPPIPAMASFGEPLPERVTRGMVLARLANFLEGHAAITPALAEAVAGLLNDGPLPPVPALGNGCPGEILALSHLFSPLASRFELGEKDSLSLINGSPCASALLADAALAARNRLALAEEVFALSIEALKAPLEAYDAALDGLWEDPHEAATLRSLRAWLEGGASERRPYQAPVSWRILPRVLGQARRAQAQAEEAAAISLRAVSDNPVFIPPDEANPNGRVFSTGGYHNGKAYPALDNLAAAWADLALLCDRHVTKLLDGKVSLLPDQLLSEEKGYMGCLGMAAVAYAEQTRQAAQRSFLPGSEGGGFGQNDVPVPTFFSWRKEAEAGRFLDAGLAMLAAVASQAFFVTGREAPPRLRPLLQETRAHFPVMQGTRPAGPDAERLTRFLTGKVFAGAAAESSVAA
ncbi:MAG: aromatic amino acid lyase [Kiloniellales bacterium]